MLKKTLTLMALCASLPALAQVPASLPAGPQVRQGRPKWMYT
jgi:hypothetical protein